MNKEWKWMSGEFNEWLRALRVKVKRWEGPLMNEWVNREGKSEWLRVLMDE